MTGAGTERQAGGGLLSEPRGRVLTELCGQPLTAIEIADRVGTSASAVRIHLEALLAAGLVSFAIERRGVGKPTHVYSLTSEAEYLLSAAYAPALQTILGALHDEMGESLAGWLRAAGSRLRPDGQSPAPRPRARGLEPGLELLRGLGAAVSAERRGASHVVRAACCPLGVVTRAVPEMCSMLEGALAAALPAHAVREHCERGEHPRCAFLVSPAAGGASSLPRSAR